MTGVILFPGKSRKHKFLSFCVVVVGDFRISGKSFVNPPPTTLSTRVLVSRGGTAGCWPFQSGPRALGLTSECLVQTWVGRDGESLRREGPDHALGASVVGCPSPGTLEHLRPLGRLAKQVESSNNDY